VEAKLSSLTLVRPSPNQPQELCQISDHPPGITHAYGGVLAALSITYTLTPLDKPQVAAETRWKERETIVAVYVDHEEVLIVDERTIVGDLALS
jgi:hypothetical protein